MTKKKWKIVLKKLTELTFYRWLDILPGGQKINAVPTVHYKKELHDKLLIKLKAEGYKFADSTYNYIEGYHIPNKCRLSALVLITKG